MLGSVAGMNKVRRDQATQAVHPSLGMNKLLRDGLRLLAGSLSSVVASLFARSGELIRGTFALRSRRPRRPKLALRLRDPPSSSHSA